MNDQQDINRKCDEAQAHLSKIMMEHGVNVLHEHVWATVGSYMVLMVQMGGSQMVEEAAVKLETMIDATRRASFKQ